MLPNEFKCRKNNKKILRNLKRFFIWIQSRNPLLETFLSFVQNLKRLLTKHSGSVFSLRNFKFCSIFPRNLFRRCAKLKKLSRRRFRDCIQMKNFFRFGRIFLLFFFRHLNSFGSILHLRSLF